MSLSGHHLPTGKPFGKASPSEDAELPEDHWEGCGEAGLGDKRGNERKSPADYNHLSRYNHGLSMRERASQYGKAFVHL
jgi:hypothetical protein